MTRRKSKRRRKNKNSGAKSFFSLLPLILIGAIAGFMLIKWSIVEIKEFRYSLPYEDYVVRYCEEYEIDPLFIYAMMKQESNFDPEAVSIDDARGLLQLTEETYDWVKSRMRAEGSVFLGDTGTFEDMFDPQTNIRYSVWLTAYLFDTFGNEETVVAAYHAGLNITKQWLESAEYSADGKTLDIIPYPDTRYHVKKVMGYYKEYKELYRSEE